MGFVTGFFMVFACIMLWVGSKVHDDGLAIIFGAGGVIVMITALHF